VIRRIVKWMPGWPSSQDSKQSSVSTIPCGLHCQSNTVCVGLMHQHSYVSLFPRFFRLHGGERADLGWVGVRRSEAQGEGLYLRLISVVYVTFINAATLMVTYIRL
jgi:hypothetical protein